MFARNIVDNLDESAQKMSVTIEWPGYCLNVTKKRVQMNPRPHLAYSLHLPQQCTLEILPAAINAYALVQYDSVSNGRVTREKGAK